jgi:hypothetical protein
MRSGDALTRETILAEWLRHFSDLAVGETAAPAGFFAGERGGGRNAPAAKSLKYQTRRRRSETDKRIA